MPWQQNLQHGRLFALLAMMTLAGCATFDKAKAPPPPVDVTLPATPSALAEPCPDPGVRAGQPALTELARNRVALAVCRNRHGRLVKYWRDVADGRESAAAASTQARKLARQ